MIPTKSGLYWFAGWDGKIEVCEIYDDENKLSVVFLGDNRPHDLEFIANHTEVIKKWLGPAKPPSEQRSATVHEMISEWMIQHGVEGLWNEEGPCGCDGTAPCEDGPYPECEAARSSPVELDVDEQYCVVWYPIREEKDETR